MLKSIAKHSLREAFKETDEILDQYQEQIIEQFELDSNDNPSEFLYRKGDKIVVEWPAEWHSEEGGFDKMVVTTHGLEVHASYPNDDYSEYEDDVTKLEWGTDIKLGKQAITAVANNLYWGYADGWCIDLINELSV